MVELITRPFVKIAVSSMLDPDVLIQFAEEHELSEFANDDNAPLSKIIDAAHKPTDQHLDHITEFAGRFCYRSWDKGRSNEEYIANILQERHGSVFAHGNVSFILTGISRSLSLELIRHHVGTNPSQESQRYVTADGGELEVLGFRATAAVVPPHILDLNSRIGGDGSWVLETFRKDFEESLKKYHYWLDLLKTNPSPRFEQGGATILKKRSNEAARAFLPNATETRMVWTMNMRAARNVVEQRANPHADLEIRRMAVQMFHELVRVAPQTFSDMTEYTAPDGYPAVRVIHSKV